MTPLTRLSYSGDFPFLPIAQLHVALTVRYLSDSFAETRFGVRAEGNEVEGERRKIQERCWMIGAADCRGKNDWLRIFLVLIHDHEEKLGCTAEECWIGRVD